MWNELNPKGTKKKIPNTWFWHANFELSSKELLIDLGSKFQNTIIIQREETSPCEVQGHVQAELTKWWYWLDSNEVVVQVWNGLCWFESWLWHFVCFFIISVSQFFIFEWIGIVPFFMWLFWGMIYWFLELSLSFGDSVCVWCCFSR